ncbi:MAG TPA: PH domain-containing protein [Pilimelia sp.]|nr:PH domain-containing protein [Pilimelia sp.]
MPAVTAPVRLRPRRSRVVCRVAAGALFVVFAGVATVLRTPANQSGVAAFGAGDQVAMVLLGGLGAALILALARPRVEADADGIRVRNLVGGYALPWSAVRAVRFGRHAPWASVELHNDDVLAVMAVQAADRQYAVDGVRALRALHAAATNDT